MILCFRREYGLNWPDQVRFSQRFDEMKLTRKVVLSVSAPAIDALGEACPELSKGRLKDAMNKGAVVLQSGKQQKRLRRAQTPLPAGSVLVLNYDDELLTRQAPAPQLLADEQDYSLWFKPAGILSQGNEWGDHLALLRLAEQHFAGKRAVFLVHRLDREASGLMLIAHQKKTAAALSQLMQQQAIAKTYRICVQGVLPQALLSEGEIRLPLDGKACCTRFRLLEQQPAKALLEVDLLTGRKHQIRRHFAAAGHAVMGDPQYGSGNKDAAGLALQAVRLVFQLPGKPRRDYQLPPELCR